MSSGHEADELPPPRIRSFSVILEEAPSDLPPKPTPAPSAEPAPVPDAVPAPVPAPVPEEPVSAPTPEPVAPAASEQKQQEQQPAPSIAVVEAPVQLSPAANEPAAAAATQKSPREAQKSPRDTSEAAEGSIQRRGGGKVQPKAEWIEGQKHTFTAWINFQLRDAVPPTVVKDLVKDLQDGVALSLLTNKLLGKDKKQVRFKQAPTMKVQKIENLGMAISALASDGLKLVNISAEDIFDANETIVLGLLWSIILRYQVGGAFHAADTAAAGQDGSNGDSDDEEEDEFAFSMAGAESASSSSSSSSSSDSSASSSSSSDGSESSSSTAAVPFLTRGASTMAITSRTRDTSLADAKNRLLEWVRGRCEPFGVQVNDFTHDFADGLAFSALSASIDERYDFFADSEAGTAKQTMERSFDFNEKELAIPQLLKADYLAAPLVPDEKSVLTYVSLLYQYHGSKKPVTPEEEVELHIDVTGDGLKSPAAGQQNAFGINVLNNRTKAVLPSTEQLSCSMVRADGTVVQVTKQHNPQTGGTDFFFTPTSTEPIDVLLKYGDDEIATMRINPAPPLTVHWASSLMTSPVTGNGTSNGAGTSSSAGAGGDNGNGIVGGGIVGNGLKVPVGSPCHLPGTLRDRNGSPVSLASDAGVAADVKLRVVKLNADGTESDTVVEGAQLVGKEDGTFEVVFTPDVVGDYKVAISARGVELPPLTVTATATCTAEWDVFSNSDVPLDVPCSLSGSLFDHKGNRLPIDDDTKVTVVGPDGKSTVSSQLVPNEQGGFDVVFTPTVAGEYQVTLDYHGTALPAKVVAASKAQVVPVNRVARVVVTDVPLELATLTTEVLVRGPNGQNVKASIDLGSNYAPVCVDFKPTETGTYRLVLDGGETLLVLPPIVARDDIEVVQIEATITQECELRIPWTSSYDEGEDTTVVLLPPPDSKLAKTEIKVVQRDGNWVVARFTPDVEGEYHIAAEHRLLGIECMLTVNAHSFKKSSSSLGRTKSKRKRPKAVEVVSVVPIDKPDRGLVRIYFGDDELPQLLGLARNFKTHPLTATSTYQEVRDTILRKFSTSLDEKMRKKLQAIVKRDQTCIVFVNQNGVEKMAPFNAVVLPDINRFKKETAERILRESRVDASAGTSSLIRRARKTDRKIDPHGTRKEIAQARKVEQKEALRLAQNVGSGSGWNQKSGTFKLVGTVHSGEHVTTLRRSNVGEVYCEVRYQDQMIKTSKIDMSNGEEPQWESKFSFDIVPGPVMDLVIHLRHTGGDDLLGVVMIPLGFLQPDMSKKAWYVLKKPSALTTLSRRRLLVTLEHHVLEIEPDTRLFLKPAPRLYLEILVNYPKTRMKVGEELLVTSEVRDETKNFCLTDDLKGGLLQLFVLPPNAAEPLILDFENTNVGIFTFTFKPTQPGSYKSMLRYSGAAMQHKTGQD